MDINEQYVYGFSEISRLVLRVVVLRFFIVRLFRTLIMLPSNRVYAIS